MLKRNRKKVVAFVLAMCFLMSGFHFEENALYEVNAINKVLKKTRQTYVMEVGQSISIRLKGNRKVKWSITGRKRVKVLRKTSKKLKLKARKTGKVVVKALS